MRLFRLLLLGSLLCLSLFSAWTAVSAQQSQPVHILYFYSEDCSHCKAVREQVLAPMQAQYGQNLVLHEFEIGQPQNYEGLVRVELHFKVASEKRGIPTLVIGDKILVGEDEIRQQLPALVQNGLAQGIPWPDIPEISSLQSSPTSSPIEAAPAGPPQPGATTPTPKPATSSGCSVDNPSSCSTGQTVWMAYFYQDGCEVCSIAKNDINYARQKHPKLIVEEFSIAAHPDLGQWMAEYAGRKAVRTPAVFIGSDALIGGEELTPQALDTLVKKYETNGAERTWDGYDPVASSMVARYKSLGPLSFGAAGLLDGLNPLALAALLVFVFITSAGIFRQTVLSTGLAFLAALFAAYLALGLALAAGVFLSIPLSKILGGWVYIVFLVIAVVLAGISGLAFFKARRGNAENSRISRFSGSWGVLIAALGAGVLAALLEFAGTGQSYLQTISFMESIPALRGLSSPYLILYNIAFVLPLTVVFGLLYYFAAPKETDEDFEEDTAEE